MSPDVAADFASHTTDHELTILRDEGVYRHVRCREPGTGIWGWDIVTWPGYLAMSGDLGSWTFTRESDMLVDFFSGRVNVGYWLEKCVSWDRHSHARGTVSAERVRTAAADHPDGDWTHAIEVATEYDGTTEMSPVYEALMDVYPDAWEWTITEPDIHAVRALHAIAWTREHYLAHQSGQEVES